MLEVHSSTPLQSGETLAWGITTRHVAHFAFGLVLASPLVLAGVLVLALLGQPPWMAAVVGAGVGAAFAVVPIRGRTLAEVAGLSLRQRFRPRVVLYDRGDRVRRRRKAGGGAS